MNNQKFLRWCIAAWLCVLCTFVHAQVSSFTYQGRLERAGEPVTGFFDFQFQLYSQESGGNPLVFTPTSKPSLGVTNGLFTTVLDFGPLFDGGTQFIEVRVRPAGGVEDYVTLSPRQRVTAAPFATRAGSLTGTVSPGQLPAQVVLESEDVRLTGVVDATNPGNRFGGDGSGLTGVLADGLGADAGVRYQEGFVRILPEARRDVRLDDSTLGVVAGDFNGDGSQDLIVSLTGIGVANLFTNAGDGRLRFQSGEVGDVYFRQKGAVSGDFNGDGKADLAFLHGQDSLLHVMTNRLGAGLVTMAYIPLTNGTGIVAADLNSDGKADLVVTEGNQEASRLRVYLSSGNGMVQASALSLPSPAADIAAGDVDGDGIPEIVIACTAAGQLRVYRSVGGVLELGAELPAVRPLTVAIGSLVPSNPSGLTYVSNAGYDGLQYEESRLRTLYRTGGLSFALHPTSLPLGGYAYYGQKLHVRDMNQDARNDAVLVDYAGFSAWKIRFFGTASRVEFPRLAGEWHPANVRDVVLADFNGNGVPDLGTGTRLGAQVWLQDGSGVTTRNHAQFSSGIGVQGPLLADGGLEVTGKAKVEQLVVPGVLDVPGTLNAMGNSTMQQLAVTDALSFGTTTRQMLNLYGTGYALGVQANTLYFRTGTGDAESGFAWFRGGGHTNAMRHPGEGGERLMTLVPLGLQVATGGGRLLLGEEGNMGASEIRFLRGTNMPSGFDVRLVNDRPGNLHLSGNSSIGGSLFFGEDTRQMINLYGREYGLGVQANSTYFRSGSDFMWFRRGQHVDAQGDPGAGGVRLMRLTTDGRLGLGVDSPAYPLDILASSAVSRMTTTNGGFGSVVVLQNRTPSAQYLGAINFEDATTTSGQIGYLGTHQMTFRVNGSQRMVIDGSGNVAITGAFSQASDRNAKENLIPIDPQEILEKVASLPLSEWNYRQDPGTRHVGPMAQDFHAAFGVGPDERHITTVDADGVALAAIQGLNRKLEASRRENAELRDRLERLERLVESRNGR